MRRANSWGSKINRDRRRAVAEKNAQAEQINCMECRKGHRRGRACAPTVGPIKLSA